MSLIDRTVRPAPAPATCHRDEKWERRSVILHKFSSSRFQTKRWRTIRILSIPASNMHTLERQSTNHVFPNSVVPRLPDDGDNKQMRIFCWEILLCDLRNLKRHISQPLSRLSSLCFKLNMICIEAKVGAIFQGSEAQGTSTLRVVVEC